jgi:hypothetical protein
MSRARIQEGKHETVFDASKVKQFYIGLDPNIAMVSISTIYLLFPILQKSNDLIFIYSPGIRDFYQ